MDAYVDTDFAPWASLRLGKFKTPVGIERLQSATDLALTERSLADNLMPNRDVGVQLSGQFGDRTLAYALAVLNGVPDGSSGDTDVNDAVDVAARVFAKPFVTNMYSPLRGAGFGLAGTWGREQGSASNSQLPTFRTPGRSTFFQYVSNNPATLAGTAVADGDHWRVSPQATWYEGQLGLMAEYVRSSEQVALGATRAWVNNDAWQVRASWVLTGEKASYDGVVPDAPFDFGGGGWGAWELSLRWASLDVDADAFANGFADPTRSARQADSLGAAIRWYLNANVEAWLDYEHTTFRGGAPSGGNRHDEDVITTRLQLAF
jgi:phosphate-selective porin OprO/OprP